MQDPLFILCIILLAAALAEWLSGKAFFRHLGGALIVIVDNDSAHYEINLDNKIMMKMLFKSWV